MKLETQHLAPYLPYEVDCVIEDDKHLEFFTLNYYLKSHSIALLFKGFEFYFKLVLRPLSQLMEKIAHFEEEVIVFNMLTKRSQFDFLTKEPSLMDWSYRDIQVLSKYHFDFQGLIENNLAMPKK